MYTRNAAHLFSNIKFTFFAPVTQSVLDNLEYELDSEKDRLLALLKSQQNGAIAERMKQLELAKLRREKRMLKKEGELDEASALIHLANKNEENRLAGYDLLSESVCMKCQPAKLKKNVHSDIL